MLSAIIRFIMTRASDQELQKMLERDKRERQVYSIPDSQEVSPFMEELLEKYIEGEIESQELDERVKEHYKVEDA